jgi:hypothetical protein
MKGWIINTKFTDLSNYTFYVKLVPFSKTDIHRIKLEEIFVYKLLEGLDLGPEVAVIFSPLLDAGIRRHLKSTSSYN